MRPRWWQFLYICPRSRNNGLYYSPQHKVMNLGESMVSDMINIEWAQTILSFSL